MASELIGNHRPVTSFFREPFGWKAPEFPLFWRDAVAIREFRDSNGVVWRVWTTIPSSARSVIPELGEGWLSFDSEVERRRFGPIPKGWEQMSDERLELICRVAVPARRSDPFGVASQSRSGGSNIDPA